LRYTINTMTHHHKEEKSNVTSLYALVGLLSGAFVGLILESSFVWIPILAIFGFLFAGFFYNTIVKGRADA
jgi:hypothetical protein